VITQSAYLADSSAVLLLEKFDRRKLMQHENGGDRRMGFIHFSQPMNIHWNDHFLSRAVLSGYLQEIAPALRAEMTDMLIRQSTTATVSASIM